MMRIGMKRLVSKVSPVAVKNKICDIYVKVNRSTRVCVAIVSLVTGGVCPGGFKIMLPDRNQATTTQKVGTEREKKVNKIN